MLQLNCQLRTSLHVKLGMDENKEPETPATETTTPATETTIKKKVNQGVFLQRMMGSRPPCGGCRR